MKKENKQLYTFKYIGEDKHKRYVNIRAINEEEALNLLTKKYELDNLKATFSQFLKTLEKVRKGNWTIEPDDISQTQNCWLLSYKFKYVASSLLGDISCFAKENEIEGIVDFPKELLKIVKRFDKDIRLIDWRPSPM